MTQPTSLAAFAKMQERKLLTGWYVVIAEAVAHQPGMTQNEIAQWIRESDSELAKPREVRRKVQPHTISPRFAEMVRRGSLVEVGLKRCSVTGEEVKTYALPETPPEALSPGARRQSKLKAALVRIVGLEQQVMQLQVQLQDATLREPMPALESDDLGLLRLGDPNPPANWRGYVISQYAKSPNAAGWRVLVGTIFAREFSNMPVPLADLLEITRAGLRNAHTGIVAATGLADEDLAKIEAWLNEALAQVAPPA